FRSCYAGSRRASTSPTKSARTRPTRSWPLSTTPRCARRSSRSRRRRASCASTSASAARGRLPSLPTNELFGSMFTTPAMRDLVSARGWLARILMVEAALAHAAADVGLISRERAAAIEAACDPGRYDPAAIGTGAAGSATPVVPLVEALRREVGPEHAGAVHLGATSQDILDTALMLMARDAVALVTADLDRVSGACAALAREHRDTPMLARTLLQPALPTTFGLKASGWLQGVLDA